MRAYLHLRYNPNGDFPGKWSVRTSVGEIRGNLPTFEAADQWARDFARDTGAVYSIGRDRERVSA